MRYAALQQRLPRFLWRHILAFEAAIGDAVEAFASRVPAGARVLDAGAGESVHAKYFKHCRYTAVDLGIGDAAWNYAALHAVADLAALPFRLASFDACLNVVTLEHVPEPGHVLDEIARAMKPGAPLLMIVPHEWEVHQQPHDYFRYTRFGMEYLLSKSGFSGIEVTPVGGFFRLLSRRLLNGLQFFRGVWILPAALVLAPPALLLPFFDSLDRDRNFTLGYICTAKRRC